MIGVKEVYGRSMGSMGGLWGRLWRSNKGVMGVIAYRHPFVRCYNHPCTLFSAPGFKEQLGILTEILRSHAFSGTSLPYPTLVSFEVLMVVLSSLLELKF